MHAPWWVGLLALVAGLAITAALVEWQHRRSVDERARQLSALADAEVTMLQERLHQYDFGLRALQAGFMSRGLDADDFERAYRSLELGRRLPGLQALVYAVHRPGPGGGSYPTVFVQPLAGNERVVGLDVRRQPANLLALEASRDSDRSVLSQPFRLIQDAASHEPDGLLLRLPAYSPGEQPRTVEERRARFIGSLAISLRISRLAEHAFRPEWRRALHLRIVDVDAVPAALVYDSKPRETSAVSGWRHSRMLEFGGRRWRLDVHDADHGRAELRDVLPLLLSGVAGSVLFALWIASLAGGRRRAVELAEAMTRRYRESEERFRAVNELLPALVLLAREADGKVIYANQAARVRLGANVDGALLDDLFEDAHRRAELIEVTEGHGWENVEAMLRTMNGDRFWANVSMSRVRINDRWKRLVVASDISQQRQLTELLSYQASHDALTELFNRREFERHVERTLAHMAGGGPRCALLYIDLDQFKLINDTSGHAAGDQLLAQLAQVMREQLRGGDVLARLGGDEFGVLACDVQDEAGARLVADRLRQNIDAYSFVWDQASYGISASIGGVLLDPSSSLKELFAQADTACYMAKEAGRNRVHFFSASDDATAQRRTEMEWAHRLRWALEAGRFRLYYQEVHPLNGLADGARLELLLRLVDEDDRVIPPGAFIPAAERYGLMADIDRWVVETALANLDRLHPEGRGLRMVAINLSGGTIEDESFIEHILSLIKRHDVDPRRLCFEITETLAVRNLALVSRFMGELRKVGCRIALDDFGVGMSSFGYLKNLPVDMIKIDGSFVQDLISDPMSNAIVRAVTDIGHQRGMQVVAEWVDSEAIIKALAALGVDHAQGYALHRPEPAMMYRKA
ncbi:bifunctional diguanylate cyclase/phosphodiesterase [Cognatilysobacter lacus]|uniref:EAL domain-containing protein n=1 Tax=Cognatilysobacter lacus TaxID=1643323 RepID=A0A5D8Z6B6_9GAMM|nr:EAL domain-containing protein [Lysobacter lacus]TZF90309.1 EAL domain-containing protein [Lysobacter lacus]